MVEARFAESEAYGDPVKRTALRSALDELQRLGIVQPHYARTDVCHVRS